MLLADALLNETPPVGSCGLPPADSLATPDPTLSVSPSCLDSSPAIAEALEAPVVTPTVCGSVWLGPTCWVTVGGPLLAPSD